MRRFLHLPHLLGGYSSHWPLVCCMIGSWLDAGLVVCGFSSCGLGWLAMAGIWRRQLDRFCQNLSWFCRFGSCLLFFFCTEVMVIWVGEVVPHTRFHQNQVLVELLCAGLCRSDVYLRCSGGPKWCSHILVLGELVFYTVLELCARPSFRSSS